MQSAFILEKFSIVERPGNKNAEQVIILIW
jgi:hypothetical protein